MSESRLSLLSATLRAHESSLCKTDEILAWIHRRNHEVAVKVERVPFKDVQGWGFNPLSGDLEHESGAFFSVVGLDVTTDRGEVEHWQQPIINQPEVGYLAILAKQIKGVLHFLLQAKIEPGNLNCVQLSPTLQATRSNYTQRHRGKKPRFLEAFINPMPKDILLDQLQSEQGARFLRKRNRNLIVLTDEDIPEDDDFRWLTLGQIKRLMRYDNLVNMDTRTVISGLRFVADKIDGDFMRSECVLDGTFSIDEILYRLSSLKSKYELVVNRMPLKDVAGWTVGSEEIYRRDRRFFRVIGKRILIENREVATWCQPLVEPMQEGLCVLAFKKLDGIIHFLLQAKIECGNFDVVELAPTIQCLTGSYDETHTAVCYLPEFLKRQLAKRTLFDTIQSEEGGRFYHEQNRNVIIELNDDFDENVPENFIWMTLGQIKEFLRFNNYLNIQVRSLISALDYSE
ncbi:MAG: NDP-hexose 2,3-dehydratase family protein [Oscillospiraceae bacterium]|nr:NDP-hexose 2,3-dehydratase family protein [Oscillospiraceae bacterium]